MKFFFLSLLDVGMSSGGRGEKDRSTQQNRLTSACITAYKNGSRRGRRRRSEPKTKEDMYNHLCGQETERQPFYGLRHIPVPHTLAAFFCGFSFYFFKHTNNSHYIILPN